MNPLALIRRSICLAGRVAVWLLDCTDSPDRAPWDIYTATYVPDDVEDFIRSAVVTES